MPTRSLRPLPSLGLSALLAPALLAPVALALVALAPARGAGPRTLRLDLVHSGTASSEELALERAVLEPLPWPGNPAQPFDTTGLGAYAFEVLDTASGRSLYSRGFGSIFGEWQTTEEAQKLRRAFSESLRLPMPTAPIQVVVRRRAGEGGPVEVGRFAVDPADPQIDRAPPAVAAELFTLQRAGEPAAKVDLLLLGDGYTAAEQEKFVRDARRLTEVLFASEPFRGHRQSFNVWGLAPAAVASGVSRPSTGVYRRSPVGASYDAFGSERYVLSFDNRAFRDAASLAPYDFVAILVNGETYGGGGIYQLYATVAVDSTWAPYVFVHEFAHHFAALADEYYTSPVAYTSAASAVQPEPWERNVTADPSGAKWRSLISPGTPLPTPWAKAEFESFEREIQARRKAIRAARRPEAEMDALFREEQAHSTALLGQGDHASAVGTFEGAAYEARGLYRPQADCIMFSRDEVGFCAVCRAAIEEIIRLYAPAP